MKTEFLIFTAGLLVSVISIVAAEPVPPIHPAPSTRTTSTTDISLSAAEWQEYRVDRLIALKANPDLEAKALELKNKIASFDQRLRDAMLKENPSLAASLAKFSGDWDSYILTPTITPSPNK